MICDDLLQYYQEVPIVPVDEGSKEWTTYLKILNMVFQRTLKEYSQYFPIYEEKITSWDKDKIDVFQDLDPNILITGSNPVIYIFEEKSKVIDLLTSNMITEFRNVFLSSVNYLRKGGEFSLLQFVEYKDIPYLIRELVKYTEKPILFGGRYLKITPNLEYYILYARYRLYEPQTKCELYGSDVEKFKQLLHLNLHIEVFSSRLYYDVLGVKSANVSGLSTTFNNPANTTMLNQIQREKQQLLKKWSMGKLLLEIDTFF